MGMRTYKLTIEEVLKDQPELLAKVLKVKLQQKVKEEIAEIVSRKGN
jgi:hypothetical protein